MLVPIALRDACNVNDQVAANLHFPTRNASKKSANPVEHTEDRGTHAIGRCTQRGATEQISASHSNEYVCIRWLLHCDATYHAIQGFPASPISRPHAMHVGFEHFRDNRKSSGQAIPFQELLSITSLCCT
jgi:hypothetical protein